MIECGKSVDVKRIDGARAVRFIGQCHGRFLVVGNSWPPYPRNGWMLADWRGPTRCATKGA